MADVIRVQVGSNTYENVYTKKAIDKKLIAGGVSTFLELTDTPGSYSGQEGKAVKVKADGTGLEFGTAGAAVVVEEGDVQKVATASALDFDTNYFTVTESPSGEANITLDIAANVNFNGFKAVAMSCDNGPSFPSTPATAQWFYRTDIKTLFIYEGAWKAIISFGSMTLYANATNGADTVGKGYGSGTSAALTLAYVTSLIPSKFGGNITVNLSGNFGSEVLELSGKDPTGPYTITFQGENTQVATLTGTGGVTGATSTSGTVTGSGFSASWANKFIKCLTGANAGQKRIIDTATTTLLTIVDYWTATPANNDTYEILEPLTTIRQPNIIDKQHSVIFDSINMDNNNQTVSTLVNTISKATFRYCYLKATTGGTAYVENGSKIGIERCFFEKIRIFGDSGSNIYWETDGSKFLRGHFGQLLVRFSKCQINRSVFDGDSATTSGILCSQNAVIDMGFVVNDKHAYTVVRNFTTTGLTADTGGQIVRTTTNQYSGNTADETATAASYGYID